MTKFLRIFMTLTASGAALLAQNLEAVSIASLARTDAQSVLTEKSDTRAKWQRAYQWSVAVVGAGTVADMASSFQFSRDGQREANSLLRSGNGGYGSKGAAIECGMVGASLLVQHFLVKRHPGLRAPLAISNFGFAAFQALNVRHNLNY